MSLQDIFSGQVVLHFRKAILILPPLQGFTSFPLPQAPAPGLLRCEGRHC
jgi:hypothetical protein